MRLFTIVFERIPVVWFLLGLLFIAGGLYLGFDNSLSFVYMLVGLFCSAYGLALFALRYATAKKPSTATRLSRNFISVGSTVADPSASGVHDKPSPRQNDTAETPH